MKCKRFVSSLIDDTAFPNHVRIIIISTMALPLSFWCNLITTPLSFKMSYQMITLYDCSCSKHMIIILNYYCYWAVVIAIWITSRNRIYHIDWLVNVHHKKIAMNHCKHLSTIPNIFHFFQLFFSALLRILFTRTNHIYI